MTSNPQNQTPNESATAAPSGAGDVLVVIPAWNEAPTIGKVVAAVRAQPEPLPVLVVDDGSTDGTAEVARAAGAEVISHATNLRKGAALMTGFRHALAHGYGAVITMDADGQHDPADLGNLLAAYRADAGDLIIGERSFPEMPFPRYITTPFGARILSWALGHRVTDNQSGYRVLTRRLMEQMRLTSTGYEMEVEMIWEALRLGMRLAWVPVRTIYYPERKKGFDPLRDTLRFLRMVWHIWRERRRHERLQRQRGGGR